jgi:hypothetical protein
MLQGLSDHITTALLDKNLNNYLNLAKSHLDLMLMDEKKKEQQRVMGLYDRKQLTQQTLENNAKNIHEEDTKRRRVSNEDYGFDDDGLDSEDELDDP